MDHDEILTARWLDSVQDYLTADRAAIADRDIRSCASMWIWPA